MKKVEKITHIEILNEELCNTYIELRDGNIEAKIAAELANLAGKTINIAKVQLEHAALSKEVPNIKFIKPRT